MDRCDRGVECLVTSVSGSWPASSSLASGDLPRSFRRERELSPSLTASCEENASRTPTGMSTVADGAGEYDARDSLEGEPLRTLSVGVALRTDGLNDLIESPRVKRDPASLEPSVTGEGCLRIDFGPSD